MSDLDPLTQRQRLDLDLVRAQLHTTQIGRELHYFAQTTSTMDDARRLAEAGAPHGAVVVADEQTAGRGTKGRIWVSPPAQSIHTTLIVRPSASQLSRLSIVSAVAASDAVRQVSSLSPTLKWPNDVQVEQRKLGGILIEAEWRDGSPRYALVGIGLNVNFDPAPWSSVIDRPATSLMVELGERQAREPLLAALYNAFEQRLAQADSDELHQTWADRLDTLGQSVTVTRAGGEALNGVATSVASDGALIVQSETGATHRLIAGEVTVRTAPPD